MVGKGCLEQSFIKSEIRAECRLAAGACVASNTLCWLRGLAQLDGSCLSVPSPPAVAVCRKSGRGIPSGSTSGAEGLGLSFWVS